MKNLLVNCARNWLPTPSKARAVCSFAVALLRTPPFRSVLPRVVGRRDLCTMACVDGAGDLKAVKQALRTELRARLAALEDDAIMHASEAVAQQLFALPEYAQSKGVACFLSMPKEFNTRPILERLFKDCKRVYLPRVESVKDHTMSMLEAASLADMDAFPPGRWNIPEPARDGPARVEALQDGSDIDLIVVPGLAFDIRGGRLGQGAGFYDRYLAKMQECKGKGTVKLVGVTIDDLIIAQVPRDDLDFLMDKVLWPSKPSSQ
mmetsp:Transcript_56665/g.91742  ORF Transcript_56665/g.91742 Transcript_56665/m.91742 type:complete len:263 (-) Transcript_56665:175-963(-)